MTINIDFQRRSKVISFLALIALFCLNGCFYDPKGDEKREQLKKKAKNDLCYMRYSLRYQVILDSICEADGYYIFPVTKRVSVVYEDEMKSCERGLQLLRKSIRSIEDSVIRKLVERRVFVDTDSICYRPPDHLYK
jgi:hypothetical protein